MMEFQHTLDTKGLMCPEPVMMLHSKVAEMSTGEIVKIEATDPATKRDIPQFCKFLGHKLASMEESEGTYLYYIEKG